MAQAKVSILDKAVAEVAHVAFFIESKSGCLMRDLHQKNPDDPVMRKALVLIRNLSRG